MSATARPKDLGSAPSSTVSGRLIRAESSSATSALARPRATGGYWKKAWDANEDGRPDPGAPAFLEPVNPDWAGNYKVRYWQKAWQDLILVAVDRIAAAGFDGLYLDIIDGFEYFEGGLENKKNPETGRTYRQDMESWVMALGQRARSRGALWIIPQNGSALLSSASYRSFISGIGIEDLFSDGSKESSADQRREVLAELARLDGSKVRLVIDYARKSKLRAKVIEAAKKENVILLLTDRDLKTLGVAQKP
jgi:cysteinyl-tRNA synthetase